MRPRRVIGRMRIFARSDSQGAVIQAHVQIDGATAPVELDDLGGGSQPRPCCLEMIKQASVEIIPPPFWPDAAQVPEQRDSTTKGAGFRNHLFAHCERLGLIEVHPLRIEESRVLDGRWYLEQVIGAERPEHLTGAGPEADGVVEAKRRVIAEAGSFKGFVRLVREIEPVHAHPGGVTPTGLPYL